MTTQAAPAVPRRVGATSRRDRWWVAPAATAATLTIFGLYSIFVAVLNKDYLYEKGGAHYLSPFYSPDLRTMFGVHLPFTYAFFVIWAPLGLRSTCYYYRKAYYRAFFLAPPACAVAGLSRHRYSGETKLPLVLNNLHRLFWYLAVAVIAFLGYDVVRSFLFTKDGSTHFGIGLGSFVMLGNWLLLFGFTFGCNSFRHLVGGKLDCFSCSSGAQTQHKLWQKVSILNGHHQLYAWLSLFSVGLTGLYIQLAAGGVFNDPHHIF